MAYKSYEGNVTDRFFLVGALAVFLIAGPLAMLLDSPAALGVTIALMFVSGGSLIVALSENNLDTETKRRVHELKQMEAKAKKDKLAEQKE